MFFEFFKLELKSAFKSPMLYIFFFLVGLMAFGAVASDSVIIGGSVGNVYKNAPHVITNFFLILGILGILFAAAFFNNAALRDHNNQFNEIMFHLPIRKAGYFWGRFLGALILSTIPLMAIWPGAWLGAVIGPLAGWADADRMGPFYAATFINNYLIFVLPNMFLAGAIIFFLAHKFKSTIISFVGAMAIIVAYFISGTFLSDIDNENLAAFTDIFGVRTYSVFSRYFTPSERNTLSPSFSGIIMQNRLIWLGVALLISVLSYVSFSFREKMRLRKRHKKVTTDDVIVETISKPQVQPIFSGKLGWQQFVSFYKANTLSITKSIVFKIVAIFGVILLFSSLLEGYEYFGLQSYPVTYKVMEDVTGSTSIFMIIIVVFFSGELVWRDRMSHIQEVINATPHNSFVSVFAKVASLVTVATILQFIFIAMGILSQVFRGYFHIELDVYMIDFFVDTLPAYITTAALFVLIQTLLNNRYVGYFVGIMFIFVWNIVLNMLHWESNMLDPGSTPGIFYSDMSGFGPGMRGTLWFNAYWLLTALIWILIAGLFWPRSTVSGIKEKWQVARANFNGNAKKYFAVALIVWLGVAGFVFYNTQILNPYKNSKQRELLQVEYESKYKKYEGRPIPVLTDIKYNIEIFPQQRNIHVRAKGKFLNKSTQAIDTLLFNISDEWETSFEIPNSTLALDDQAIGIKMFKLNAPLLPGETIEMSISSKYETNGFGNNRGNTSILINGTFLTNREILPELGYTAQYELNDKNDRKKYGLSAKLRAPKLERNCGEKCMVNYLSGGRSDWVNVETIISTSPDQIAVAPGSLLKEWEDNGRRYFHYKVDHPSQNFYNFMSARYEVARDKYNDIDVEVYYDKKHAVNVQKMLAAVKKSFAYYENNFGPYYHKQARILEFPRYSTFAQAFPGTMPYSESFGFITNLEDESENNVVDAVIAHEMGHQWWAHQEIPAEMQGGTMLTETFAEYSSLMVMKKESGNDPIIMKNFLKYDFDRYLRGRTTELEKELPLYKVENQGYIHYGKGSVLMYALQDYIGEDRVNAALQSFLQKYAYAEPPYPTTYDFLAELKPHVPDSLQYLINDWFKEITLYDFRLEAARFEKQPNGKYKVTMDLESKKFYADTLGNETEQPIDMWVDLGVYADIDEEILMNYERIHLTGKSGTYTIMADSIPAKAAIDPRRMLIERVIKDNVKVIENKD